MRQSVANLLLIIVVGGILYFVVGNTYTEGTANIIGLGYFLLTIRFLDILEYVEESLWGSSSSVE